ncbi:type II toxin-antitoxin system CcdA family antitoxin [Desulfonatronovibrio magnus]|uniref:type II toxin-antitoxin system CcdA family antitoxin n=1 Tax=Desulfonatronovibrio magnus TaxID=698827 RepID=UPI000695A74B|nr:type II toxin-antitoxin system CcdA family antitoxin [Desulfonatronovibrio magnus]
MSLERFPLMEQRTISVSVNESLMSEAERLDIDVSKVFENGLSKALMQRRDELWLEENMAALVSSNSFVEKAGLPLEKYRVF